MDRLVLSDAAWERMAPLIIGRPDQKGSTGRDNRMFVEGVLWIVRMGSPWRDLPEAFGDPSESPDDDLMRPGISVEAAFEWPLRDNRSKRSAARFYTGVSTDQELDQEFNSLDAQYDASSAYIEGQIHAGGP